MEKLSKEEAAARMAHVEAQQAILKRREDLNEMKEALRRSQVECREPDKEVKSEPNNAAPIKQESELIDLTDETDDPTPETTRSAPTTGGPVAQEGSSNNGSNILRVSQDPPPPNVEPHAPPQPAAGTSLKRDHSGDAIQDIHYFGLLVEDLPDRLNEFRTICRALEGDRHVELTCKYCGCNSGGRLQPIVLFKGVTGLRAHILFCHPSQLEAGESLTIRKVVELCGRPLSETEKQMVDHKDPAFMVEKVLGKGADANAPITAPRRKRSRFSQESAGSDDLSDTVVVKHRSLNRSLSTVTISAQGDTEPVDAAEELKCDAGVSESESIDEAALYQQFGMVTRNGGKRE